ncbi:MAG: alpha-glucosidase [Mogibacterium sp.]|nr:alpha-glucosidase [Mogibacterium sp.]
MLKTEFDGKKLRLTVDGFELLSTPFVSAIRHEKTYSTNRGTVKETIVELEHAHLDGIERMSDSTFVMSGDGHSLKMEVRECDLGCELFFEGEEGWAYEFRIPAIEGEAVFGGGEQYRQTNLRGERIMNFVSEHITARTLMEKVILPDHRYREKTAESIGSYSPMPVFVTDRGRLFYFDTASDGISKFGIHNYRLKFDKCPRSLMLLHAGDYDTLMRALARKNPPGQYLPDWCLNGMIIAVQGGTDKVISKAFTMLDAGAKISAVWSQDWCGENRTVMGKQVWWNYEYDDKLYHHLPEAIRRLESRGVHFLAYINPYMVKGSRLYNKCAEKGWLIKNKDGSICHMKSTTFDAGMLDLTDPEAVRFIKEVLIKKNMLDIGIKGWMADFGEYLPTDCVLHDGDPAELHNMWPVIWARINREAIEEYGDKDVMFFTRSGYLGEQCYAPIMWNGDQHTDLTKDYGMPCVMPATFSLGFSGVPLVHSDIGGFFSIGKLKRDDELFIRWMEMNTFSPLMRSHESIRPWANSQFDAQAVLPYTVCLTNIHAALRPYIERCIEQAAEGIPVMRPDFWNAVDYSAGRDEYSYFFGDDMYVCPVIEKNARERTVYLPEGEWTGFWDNKAYRGGSKIRVRAPLGRIPVFYRSGSSFRELFRKAAVIKKR